MSDVYKEMVRIMVESERKLQDKKWGVQDHTNSKWLTILTEEVGEAAKEILENNPEKIRNEVVQVAAVAIAWLECYERGGTR